METVGIARILFNSPFAVNIVSWVALNVGCGVKLMLQRISILATWIVNNCRVFRFCFFSTTGSGHREMQRTRSLFRWLGQNGTNMLPFWYYVGPLLQNNTWISGWCRFLQTSFILLYVKGRRFLYGFEVGADFFKRHLFFCTYKVVDFVWIWSWCRFFTMSLIFWYVKGRRIQFISSFFLFINDTWMDENMWIDQIVF